MVCWFGTSKLSLTLALLEGLLNEMVNEAWQTTLSFWANERWWKFVYRSLSATMDMT